MMMGKGRGPPSAGVEVEAKGSSVEALKRALAEVQGLVDQMALEGMTASRKPPSVEVEVKPEGSEEDEDEDMLSLLGG